MATDYLVQLHFDPQPVAHVSTSVASSVFLSDDAMLLRSAWAWQIAFLDAPVERYRQEYCWKIYFGQRRWRCLAFWVCCQRSTLAYASSVRSSVRGSC